MDRIEGRLLEAFIQSRMPSSSSIQANGSDSARDGLRRDEPAKPLPVVPNSIIPEPGTLKPRRPVLTVLGLMRDQFEHVRTKCAETCFELRWVDKEASRPSFGRTDYIVAQRHHSHAWWDAAIAAVPKGNAVFSGGGISDTVQRIFDLHAREMALARQGRSSI